MTQIEAMLALDKTPALHWRVECNPCEAYVFALEAKDSPLRQVIEEVNRLIPRIDYGPENGNTGATIHTFYIGKENSRVVYIDVVKTYFMNTGQNVDYDDFERKITNIAKKNFADEIDRFDEDLLFRMRIWWD